MDFAIVSVGALTILATLLPLVRSERWWIRIFDYPRQQIAIVIAATAVVFPVHYQGDGIAGAAFTLALVLALGLQLFRIWPYTPFARRQVPTATACAPGARIRLMIANVLMSNRQVDRFLRLVAAAGPDVLLAVETDAWWDRRLSELSQAFPFAVRYPLDNTYGLHLFSRLELVDPKLRYLVEEGVPSIEAGLRLPSGPVVGFFGVHPKPPQPAQDTGERDAELLIVGRAAKAAGRPAIVAGDLNDVAWSHTSRLFQRISGLSDPRVGRGLFPTFHAKIPFARWPLDHVFHDASFKLREIRRLGAFGSDHFPMLVELCYAPAAATAQAPPAPDAEDRAEAAERIRTGRTEGAARRGSSRGYVGRAISRSGSPSPRRDRAECRRSSRRRARSRRWR